MRKEWFGAVIALAVVAMVSYVWLAPPAREPAPAVTLPTLEGESAALSDYRGGPVMVVFWATTCTTCIAEMPDLVALHEKLAGRGLSILGVAMAYDPPEQVRALVKRRALPYEIVLDNEGAIARAFDNVRVTPTTVLIDPAGQIVWQRIGHLDFDAVESQIRGMLDEAQAS